ncbi:MAG: metallophosphoesterase [Verrucomicrobiota bacterium]
MRITGSARLSVAHWVIALLLSALVTFAAEVRVALFSDTHWAPLTNKNQRAFRANLDKVIAAVNQAEVKLVVITGDLTENGKTEEYREVKQKFAELKAPTLWIPGNHDVGAKIIPTGKRKGVTSASVQRYEAIMGPSSFCREESGVRVIGINSALLGSGLPEEQALWGLLEKALAKPGDKPTLLLTHYPLYVEQPDEPGGEYWNVEPEPRQRLLKLLKQGGVKAVLSGHLHRTVTNSLDGMAMITTTSVAFGLPSLLQPDAWTLLTVPATGNITYEFKKLEE